MNQKNNDNRDNKDDQRSSELSGEARSESQSTKKDLIEENNE